MFDIGFFELVVIALVALIVVGPERLPEVARTLGQWAGRLRRTVNGLKNEVGQELSLQEYQKLHQAILEEARKTGQSFELEAEKLHREMQAKQNIGHERE